MAWSLFRRDEPVVTAPVVPQEPFHVKLVGWAEELSWLEREMSGVLSTEVFSRLRVINDVFFEVAGFLENYPVRAEDEYILESTVRDYIPTALNIFNQLPSHEQVAGGSADRMLLEQCDSFERSIRALNSEMHERVRNNLQTQTIFVENRFSNQP